MTFQQLLNTKQFLAALERAERDVVLKAYEHSCENQSATARLLGVSRGTLRERLKQYGVLKNS